MRRYILSKTRYLHEIDLKELVLPLVVLDFSQEVAADADFILTREHIKQWEAEHGSIEPGTLLPFVAIGPNGGQILNALKIKMQKDNYIYLVGAWMPYNIY